MIARSVVLSVAVLALMSSTPVTQAADRTPPCTPPTYGGAGETSACIWWFNDESGDDLCEGLPTCWEIRQSSSPITGLNWGSAPVIASGPCLGSSDQGYSVFNLTCNTTYYFVVFFFDDVGNRSIVPAYATRTTDACGSNEEESCDNDGPHADCPPPNPNP